jgi:glycosyltransferase involved in cell wall biosynthesis
MRILHLFNASDAGGLSRYVIDLSVGLKRSGHEVWAGCDRGAWHGRFVDAGLTPIDLPLGAGLMSVRKSAKVLNRWLDANAIDVIHTHYRKSTLLARKVARGRAILYTLHLSHINLSGWRRWVSDFGDHVHIASEDARQWLNQVAKVDDQRITCIPHGIDLSRWPATTPTTRATARQALNLPQAARVMLFVGRLDDPKNVDWVVRAHERATKSMPDLHTLIVGDGPHRASVQASIDRGASRLQLLGERDPLQTYQAADLFVLPSGREGFSYVCAEALATGLPVLRTRTTGTSETVIENLTGRSVPIDESAFVAGVIEMLTNAEGLIKMRPACVEHARTLTFDRQLRDTIALYGRLCR